MSSKLCCRSFSLAPNQSFSPGKWVEGRKLAAIVVPFQFNHWEMHHLFSSKNALIFQSFIVVVSKFSIMETDHRRRRMSTYISCSTLSVDVPQSTELLQLLVRPCVDGNAECSENVFFFILLTTNCYHSSCTRISKWKQLCLFSCCEDMLEQTKTPEAQARW